MPGKLTPRLEILPAAQRELWMEMSSIPPDFVLYGGTAIALRYGHRQSLDFDFFSHTPFDPGRLAERIPFLARASVLHSEANTLTCRIARGDAVMVSFFAVPRLGQIQEPDATAGTGVRVASALDLAGTKVSVVQRRSEAKDYLDIAALIAAGIDLPMALAAGTAVYGAAFNAQITLKALCFFDDGNLSTVPSRVRQTLVEAVAAVDLDRLPSLTPIRAPRDLSQ